ncbi:MAG: DUF4013 domain-containing protein [Haloferacaceae archaeon]
MALTDEIDYPSRGDDALKTMLIGGALLFAAVLINLVGSLLTIILIGFLLLPFAFIPQLLTQGYLVRVLDDTVEGGVEPPVWDDWVDVFVDGLKLFVVVLAYSLPLVVLSILFALLFAGLSVGAGAGGDAGNALAGVSAVLALVFGLVALVVGLAVAYLAPAGLCGMVHDDAIGGAFDLDRLREVGTSREYAVAWGAGALTLVVGGGVAQVLIFLLVGFPLLFAAQVLAFRFFARGYADALGLDVPPEGATPTAAATSVPDPDPTRTDTLGAERPTGTDTGSPDPADERDEVDGGSADDADRRDRD